PGRLGDGSDQVRPDNGSVAERVRITGTAVMTGADEQIAVSGFNFGNNRVNGRGEDDRLLLFVEKTQLWGEPRVDGVFSDEATGHRVDGADECGADLLGGGDVPVIEESLLRLFDEVGRGADGEGGGDDFAGAKDGLAVVCCLRQSFGEHFRQPVGLSLACRGGDDVTADEWSPAMPYMRLKLL